MFWKIITNELKISGQNINKIISSFLFFVIFIFISQILSKNNQNTIDPDILFWLATISVIVFSSADFLKSDYDSGMLEQMILACYNFEIFIFAKIIANWLNYSLPIIIISCLINFDYSFIIIAILTTFTINAVCCFCGSFSLLGNSSPLIAFIALPFIIPSIIIAKNNIESWTILLPLALLSFFILSFFIAKIVQIIID